MQQLKEAGIEKIRNHLWFKWLERDKISPDCLKTQEAVNRTIQQTDISVHEGHDEKDADGSKLTGVF